MTKITIQDDTLDAISTIDMHYHVAPVTGKGSSLVAFSIDGRTIPANLIPPSSFPPGYLCVFLFRVRTLPLECGQLPAKACSARGNARGSSFFAFCVVNWARFWRRRSRRSPSEMKKPKKNLKSNSRICSKNIEDDTVGLIDRDDALSIAQQRFFKEQKAILRLKN